MSLHIVGNPNDYGGDDNPPEHGRDTAIYQELLPIRDRFVRWYVENKRDIPNDETDAMVHHVTLAIERLLEELNQPL